MPIETLVYRRLREHFTLIVALLALCLHFLASLITNIRATACVSDSILWEKISLGELIAGSLLPVFITAAIYYGIQIRLKINKIQHRIATGILIACVVIGLSGTWESLNTSLGTLCSALHWGGVTPIDVLTFGSIAVLFSWVPLWFAGEIVNHYAKKR